MPHEVRSAVALGASVHRIGLNMLVERADLWRGTGIWRIPRRDLESPRGGADHKCSRTWLRSKAQEWMAMDALRTPLRTPMGGHVIRGRPGRTDSARQSDTGPSGASPPKTPNFARPIPATCLGGTPRTPAGSGPTSQWLWDVVPMSLALRALRHRFRPGAPPPSGLGVLCSLFPRRVVPSLRNICDILFEWEAPLFCFRICRWRASPCCGPKPRNDIGSSGAPPILQRSSRSRQSIRTSRKSRIARRACKRHSPQAPTHVAVSKEPHRHPSCHCNERHDPGPAWSTTSEHS